MAKVFVTVPNLHWIHKTVVHCLLKLQLDRRYPLRIEMPSNKPLENLQHHIVRDFLASDCTHWLTIDDENPPTRNPLDLVELDKDIIGLPTPVWHYEGKPGERPIYWNVYRWDGAAEAYREWTVREGLQKVDAVGGGCMVIHRRVFEHPQMQRAPFARRTDEFGRVDRGNDLSFCERARAAGFEVYAHFGYPCDHMVEVSLNECARAINGLT